MVKKTALYCQNTEYQTGVVDIEQTFEGLFEAAVFLCISSALAWV